MVIPLEAGCSIIGSGLIGSAFRAQPLDIANVWIYAAGVSNSSCSDPDEFARERSRLTDALKAGEGSDAFVYFSTCSINDPAAEASPYVKHKREMESLVGDHRNYLIIRLPQLAGRSPNPHTLLNYLYAKISRSERFTVWVHATRNIIDVDDAVAIVGQLLREEHARRKTINVACLVSYPIHEIIAAIEKVVGKQAVMEKVEKGAPYDIDTSTIQRICRDLKLRFDERYLERVITKYYKSQKRYEYQTFYRRACI
jgi:nucleoside-diphosphate-sugar epimerase